MHEYQWQTWNNLTEPEKRYFEDIEVFKTELQKLLERKRDQFPRGGELLILINKAKIYGPSINLEQRIQLGEILQEASFNDMGNVDWGMKLLDNQLHWWRAKLAFDVVFIPGYTDKEHFCSSYLYYSRIFTRPTYLEINNKK